MVVFVGKACEDMSGKSEKVNKKTQLVANEIKLAKVLSGNDKKIRDRALKRLKKWFQYRSLTTPFTEDDFALIWKGLFFSMWMSDKPLIQEECAENISKLIHFEKPDTSLLFFKCALQTLSREWTGIDQLRLDKFLMFVRRLLRQSLIVLKNADWNKNVVTSYCDILSDCVLNMDKNIPIGLTLHFTEVFLEELAKVSEGELKPHVLTQFLRPFAKHLATSKDARQIGHIKKFIFKHLIRQSEVALEFEDKFQSWRKLGFPGDTIDSMQKVEVDNEDVMSDDEDHDRGDVLDPRAGRVDVELPQLKLNAKEIAKLLKEHKFLPGSTTKSRKTLTKLAEDFMSLPKCVYPYGIKKVDRVTKDKSTNLKQAVNRLVKLDNKLLGKKRKRNNSSNLNEQVVSSKKQKLDDQLIANEFNNDSIMTRQKLKPQKAKQKVKDSIIKKISKNEKFDHSFKRHSGMWYVFKVNNKTDGDTKTPVTNHVSESAIVTDISDANNSNETDILITPRTKLKIKGKNRFSLDSNLVINPFSRTNSSGKKVKIDLKLNRSQEVHEHVVQVRKSPGIPFDANKKPLKPLLKPGCMSSPINPFYERKPFCLFTH